MNIYNDNQLIISKTKIIHNLNVLNDLVKNKQKISAVLKANAYGTGLIEYAEILDEYGIKKFCVAKPIEAFKLREHGFQQEILILGNTDQQNFFNCLDNNIMITIHNEYSYDEAINFYKKIGRPLKAHIKYNTGMNRIGFNNKNRIIDIVLENSIEEKINIRGVFSHLSKVYDCDVEFTKMQIKKFEKLINELEILKIKPSCVHLLGSGGIIQYNPYIYDMCRPGCCIYGLLPSNIDTEKNRFKEIFTFKSKIIQIHNLKPEESVGYSNGFITKSNTKIAILPLGYADGLPRRLSNKGKVIIKGNYYSIVGNISMDMCSVDITSSENVNVGDSVIIIGEEGDCRISINDIAKEVDTVRTEILINISDRVQRIYEE